MTVDRCMRRTRHRTPAPAAGRPVRWPAATASNWSSCSRSGGSGCWSCLLGRAGAVRRRPASRARCPLTRSSAAGCTLTGWAGPLVVLGFAGTLGAAAADLARRRGRIRRRGPARHLAAPAGGGPLAPADLRREVAGQPDRHGAAGGGLAASGIAGGLLAVGDRPLVGLDGHAARPGDAAGTVAARLALRARPDPGPRRDRAARLGRAGPVADGSAAAGARRARDAVAQILPLPVAVRLALPGYAFISWNGLFTEPGKLGPAADRRRGQPGVGRRRDRAGLLALPAARLHQPANDGAGRRVVAVGILPLAGLLVATIGILAVSTPTRQLGDNAGQAPASLATAFGHLYRLQKTSCTAPRSPRRSYRPQRPAPRATASSTKKAPATTGAARSRGTYPAPR